VSRYKNPEYRAKNAEYQRQHRAKNPGSASARFERWKAKNPEKYKLIQKNSSLKKLYGITVEERDLILQSQGGRCAICRTDQPGPRGWFIDHCHSLKRVRGILCQPCNSTLGYARDDVAILKAAISYLKRGLLFEPKTRK
jgi:hypothetical protein